MKKILLPIVFLFLSAMVYAQESGEPGGDHTPTVTIDGLQYKLSEATNTAMVANANTWNGELVIPEEVNYEGKSYTVDRIEWLAFNSCKTLTKVRIPKTIVDIQHYSGYEDCKNPFTGCTSLESIEVDEANPNMCSVDGVLFNKDMTWLFCYPAGLRSETYTIPDGVTRLGGNAFAYNPYLLSVQMPNSVTRMAFGIFSNCKSLKSVQLSENIKFIEAYTFESCDNLRFLDIPESVTGFAEGVFRWSPLETILIRGTFPDGLRYDTFYNLDEERTVIYCYPSEIDKFKTVFKGTVLPLGDWTGIYFRPLINDNKEWTMAYLSVIPQDFPGFQQSFDYEQIKLGSTIEVDGMTLKQIVRSEWNYGEDGPTNWKETEMYIGEVDGKVYFYDHWSTSYHLVQVMDFTLQEGDTYRQHTSNDDHDNYADFVVVAVTDTVIATSVDKTPRKCLYIGRVGESKIYDVWVEGIGSLVSGVYGTYSYFMNGAIPTLRTCKEDGQTLYEAYHPLLKQGKTWNCQEYYSNGWTGEQWTKDVTYVINGTTPIGGKTYYVMYRITEEDTEFYCLREEGRKVWIKPPYDSERLLYDFGMSVGDSYRPNDYEYDYQLTNIQTMRFQYDQLLKVFYYDISEHYDVTAPANHIATAPIVEGVGCEKGWNITELYAPQPTNGIHNNEILLSCYEDGKCIFTADDFNKSDSSQTDYFYYSSGNKIPLTLNENKVVVSIPKDCGDITERFLANTRTLDKIFDEYFDIFLILRSDFNKLTMLDFWAEDSKSVILSSCYFTENHEEIYATPYLNVRLKKEEDIDLLTSYAEQYKLNIVKNSPLMPLWYILNITPDSGMNTLECANALHESGDFEASLPDFANNVKIGLVYRPFVEDNKVWKVGDVTSGNPVQLVEYYYFDGDTIIDGKTCKQMMCQRYVAPEHPDYDIISQQPSLNYVGAWYEENQKVYEYDTTSNQFKLMYDFSLEDYGTFQKDGLSYVVGRRQTNGIKGFKGVYRDVLEWADEKRYRCAPWLEGVGIVYGPPTINICNVELMDPASFLMECYVDDEVIYLNDEYEDGATPAGARKQRIDFTHTIKEKPKTRMRGEEEQSLYGEYNEHQLNINLNPINDAYMVSITDESGKAVYEKAINAASIVGLNIDISKYPEGNYTVTVENSNESFTGEFKAQLTGIEAIRNKKIEARGYIYNLQGQRLSSLQKGLNIFNGKKVIVR